MTAMILGDSLSSPRASLKYLLLFSNLNKLLSNTKANKRKIIPRRSPFLLKNPGTQGLVLLSGMPDRHATTPEARAWTAGYISADQPEPELKA